MNTPETAASRPVQGVRFVPFGAVAPDPPPAGELWLDVGNRVAPRVLDHHGGDTSVWCAAKLVLARHEDLVLAPLAEGEPVTLVLHTQPDLDAVASAWLARIVLERGRRPLCEPALASMVAAVAENDQGLVRTRDPLRSWPVVMRILLGTAATDDHAALAAGLDHLDRTLAVLAAGRTLADAAEELATPDVRIELSRAERDYLEDLSRATVFQLRLPASGGPELVVPSEAGPQPPPDRCSGHWSLADAVFLDDPRSSLFKELARADQVHAPMGRGFSAMVVSRDARIADQLPMWRHTVSTDPLTGLHLKGLGARLERREHEEEDAGDAPLRPGRERLPKGTGRHGNDVASPWYDGRGHGFTIVDSPAMAIDDTSVCASILEPDEVLEEMWAYGDPGGFIGVRLPEVHLAVPVRLEDGWEQGWSGPCELSDVCPELCLEVRESDRMIRVLSKEGDVTAQASTRARTVHQEVWALPSGLGLWLATWAVNDDVDDLRQLTEVVAAIRDHLEPCTANRGVRPIPGGRPFTFIRCHLDPAGASLTDASGSTAAGLHLLATGRPSRFGTRPCAGELGSAHRVLARDERALLHSSDRGAVLVTTHGPRAANTAGVAGGTRFHAILALALVQRLMVADLSTRFVRHRSQLSPVRASRLILADQWELLRIEQELSVGRVVDEPFAQECYEAVVRSLDLPEQLELTRAKIAAMARVVRDAKAALFQRVGVWVSILLAPLAVAAGIFGGQQFRQNATWGWFTATCLGLATFLVLVWIATRLRARQDDPLHTFHQEESPPDG